MIVSAAHPENQKEDIGHFMMAAGAVIKHPNDDKILLLERVGTHHNGEWEIVYGRLAQHEEITMGLLREIREETGLSSVLIEKPLRFWHVYRGDKHAETEVFGMTFVCQSSTDLIEIDKTEHSSFKWVHPRKALSLIKVPGIKKDVELYLESSNSISFDSIENKELL